MRHILSLVIIGFVVSIEAASVEKYSDKYDHIDIDAILKNDRVLTSYINCILDKGSCTQEGRDFREYIPNAIATSCAKCTEAQKKIVKKSSKYIMEKRKDEWKQIQQKYDPNGKHTEQFYKFLGEP